MCPPSRTTSKEGVSAVRRHDGRARTTPRGTSGYGPCAVLAARPGLAGALPAAHRRADGSFIRHGSGRPPRRILYPPICATGRSRPSPEGSRISGCSVSLLSRRGLTAARATADCYSVDRTTCGQPLDQFPKHGVVGAIAKDRGDVRKSKQALGDLASEHRTSHRGHVKVGARVDEDDWLVGCHFGGGRCGGLAVPAGWQDDRIGLGVAKWLTAGSGTDVGEVSAAASGPGSDQKPAGLTVERGDQRLAHGGWGSRAA